MEQQSMTALVSAFSRAYHSQNNEVKVFDDSVAKALLSEEEFTQIAASMTQGIKFFDPTFEGNEAEALRQIVDNQLSPSPLGRAAFTENALAQAAEAACSQVAESGIDQYLILAAGYDTFAYRQPQWAEKLELFEIDRAPVIADKRRRLAAAGISKPGNLSYIEADFTEDDWQEVLTANRRYNSEKPAFCSLLGIIYYLSEQDFIGLLSHMEQILASGSFLAFDYPDENSYTDKAGSRAKKQSMLAGGANEKMLSGYSQGQMEKLLSHHGFQAQTHLTPDEITAEYFARYNEANPEHPITAFDNVNYCLAVKK